MSKTIYKIVPADLWQQSEHLEAFSGAGIDLIDGFIHFSTGKQVRRTAELYFKGQAGLLLVVVDGDALPDTLVFEPSRDGELFPHLYGPLDKKAVKQVLPLPLDRDGRHVFPEDLA